MAYIIAVLTIIVYLIRPAEWVPFLGFNWNMLLNSMGILFICAKAFGKNTTANFDRSTIYLFSFIVAIILSSVANFRFGTITLYFTQLLSIIITFMLVQAAINTPKQINRFILIFIVIILFICFQCHLQVQNGVNWGGLEPYSRGVLSSRDEETGIAMIREYQVIWYGVFGDPNDLGMLLIAFFPYIFNKFFFQPAKISKRLFWLVAMVIIAYTIYLTNSRGTMVALLAGLSSYFVIKKKSIKALFIIAFLGVIVITLGPSRLAEISSGDSSSMGRIYAWIEALGLFRMNPVFGIGAKEFLNYHFITTHNSFVLALVETGIIGFTAYFSLFIIAVYTAIKVAYLESNDIKRLEMIALTSGLIGIMASIFFISRTYVLLPYLYIAILTTYIKIHAPETYRQQIKQLHFAVLFAMSVGFIIFLYLFNRLSTNIFL